MLTVVFISTSLLGAAFPLLSQAFVAADDHTGRGVSYLYLSNILGSAAGSLLIGFYVTDHLSLRDISTNLLFAGAAVALMFSIASRAISRITILGLVGCCVLAGVSRPLYSHLYERLLYRTTYRNSPPPGT